MSYCRWSSDDWRSDLYVYESLDGWEVLVAGRRKVPEFFAALPAEVPWPTDWRDEAQTDPWFARQQAVTDMLDGFGWVDLPAPYAGEMVTFDSADEAADALVWLAACGFHVPDGVIDAIRSDAAPSSPTPGTNGTEQ